MKKKNKKIKKKKKKGRKEGRKQASRPLREVFNTAGEMKEKK